MPRSQRTTRLMAVTIGLSVMFLVGAVVVRGQAMARWRDHLGRAFLSEHLVPTLAVGTHHVAVGPVALSAAGGPTSTQRLWVAGDAAVPADRPVLNWETVRLEPAWFDLTGTAYPGRVIVQQLELDLTRPGALTAMATIRRLSPVPAALGDVEIVVAGGQVTVSREGDRPPLVVTDVHGRIQASDPDTWQVNLRGRSELGQPADLTLRVGADLEADTPIDLQVRDGSHQWRQRLDAPERR